MRLSLADAVAASINYVSAVAHCYQHDHTEVLRGIAAANCRHLGDSGPAASFAAAAAWTTVVFTRVDRRGFTAHRSLNSDEGQILGNRFCSEYMSLLLLAEERGKHFRRVLKELNSQGIEPACDLKKIGARIYARRNVTANSH